MLLLEESHSIDHLLGSCPRRLEPTRQSSVFPLQKLDPLRRNHSFNSCGLQALETRLGLKRTPTKRGQLVTEMLHELLELGERGFLRSYAVGHQGLPRVL